MTFTLLILALAVASSLAQFSTNQFGSPLTQSGYPNANTGYPSGGNPFASPSSNPLISGFGASSGLGSQFGQQSSSQRPSRPLATMRATNKAGDALLLTLEDEGYSSSGGLGGIFGGQQSAFGGQQSPFGGQQSPFGGQSSPFGGQSSPFGRRSPFGRSPFGGGQSPFGGGSRGVRVHGVFMKAGAQTGVTSQDSLHGVFVMVVASNGNTDGYCIGTGEPYRPPSRSSPFSPFGSGGRFGSQFGGGNPFSQFFQTQQRGQPAAVSTPLHASTGTSTIEGRISNVRLAQIIGRSIHVCGDPNCLVKTDLCGIIGRDQYSIETFTKYKQQYQQHLGLTGVPTAPLGGGGLDVLGGGTNLF